MNHIGVITYLSVTKPSAGPVTLCGEETKMLTVNEFMTVNPLTVGAKTPLKELLQLITVSGNRFFPVMVDECVVGLVTEEDVQAALKAPMSIGYTERAGGLAEPTVEMIMMPDPLTVTPDTSIYLATEMLSAYRLGALPVVMDGMLVGLVTVRSLLNYLNACVQDKVLD